MHMQIETDLSLAQQHSLAVVLAGLLQDADRAMDTDRQAARAFITRAAGLLQLDRGTPPGEKNGEKEKKPARPVSMLAPWQMRRVLAHIEAALPAPIPLQDIAGIARLSPGHFSRAFKGSFGVAPHGYILRRRVERAQELMLTTNQPLCDIALACGFCDQAHFCRLFRRMTGASPSTWRRARLVGLAA